MRRPPAVALAALAGACLALGGWALWPREPEVTAQQARWAIARAHLVALGDVSLSDAGCYTMRPGPRTIQVGVADASYHTYLTIYCENAVARDGRDLLNTITQSWDDGKAPDGSSPLGWARRLLYHRPAHIWRYRVHPDGTVETLPERGQRTPQSYYH